eukprot:c960_g1_i1.p4 GENE.c960_g1_i1~~c960_g1_i1.p4  ORF type:complete len:113 (+),score=23.14 c960_g1_i1:1-339(+)
MVSDAVPLESFDLGVGSSASVASSSVLMRAMVHEGPPTQVMGQGMAPPPRPAPSMSTNDLATMKYSSGIGSSGEQYQSTEIFSGTRGLTIEEVLFSMPPPPPPEMMMQERRL